MKAAGLKAIDTVMESTAILVQSENPSNPELVKLIASRIEGVIGRPPLFPLPVIKLTCSSCSKICPMSIQRPQRLLSPSNQDHTRKTSSYYQRTGRRRMGSRQFHG